MIPFIFFISMIIFLLVIGGFIFKSYALGMISTFGMMAVGVYILSEGMRGIENLLTITVGSIFICLGVYIFIGGHIEQIQELM